MDNPLKGLVYSPVISSLSPYSLILTEIIHLKYNKKERTPKDSLYFFTTFTQRLVEADALTKLDVE